MASGFVKIAMDEFYSHNPNNLTGLVQRYWTMVEDDVAGISFFISIFFSVFFFSIHFNDSDSYCFACIDRVRAQCFVHTKKC